MTILHDVQHAIRLLMMLLKKQRRLKGFKCEEGGLMVVLWTGPGVPGGPVGTDAVNGTVAAAGPWCRGVTTGESSPGELLQKLFPSGAQCPDPDPEELCCFTALHGPIHYLISFQVKGARQSDHEWSSDVEAFLHKFSLTNARVKIHLSFTSHQKRHQQIFSGKTPCKITLKDQWSTFLDVNSNAKPGPSVGERPWCLGGHPVTGERLSLSIPPAAMERGLYGELSLQPIALLAPCVLQYPNLATRLTHIQVLVYSPSNTPIASPPDFLKQLPVHLACEELGVHGLLRCPTPTDMQHRRAGTTLPVDRGNEGEAKRGCSLAVVEQNLTLFLFLRHTDPFTSELCDVLAAEGLLEHHLEAILNNNRQAVTAALQREIKNALSALRQRSKASEKMCSAFDVMLSSALSIVSSSSNLEFRTACLDNMRVRDTHGLSLALREAQTRVSSWKLVPKGRCHSA